jgi:hypothetical protein
VIGHDHYNRMFGRFSIMVELDLDVSTRRALNSLRNWLFAQGRDATFSFGLLNDQATAIIHGRSAPSTDPSGAVPIAAVSRWTGSAADGGKLSFRLDLDTGEIQLELTRSHNSSSFSATVQFAQNVTFPDPSWLFDIRGPRDGNPLYQLSIAQVSAPSEHAIADGNGWLVPSWVAEVRSKADQLQAGLMRVALRSPSMPYETDYRIAWREIGLARCFAARAVLTKDNAGRKRADRSASDRAGQRPLRVRRRVADWWTGYCVDRAWGALLTANQAVLMIADEDEVKSQLADLKANVVHELTAGDLRINDFLRKLDALASADKEITSADRAQLREIREVCDSAGEAGHVDARSFRNTLILISSLLSVVLIAVTVAGAADKGFRALFAVPPPTYPNPWFVLEIELIASLSGLAGAVFSLKSYTGFRWTYGLPFVQALVKGATGAATGLFGVLLVRSGIVTFLKITNNIEVFAVVIVFGYAQYLFTRVIDQKANDVLKSASSRNDPSATPQVPAGSI